MKTNKHSFFLPLMLWVVFLIVPSIIHAHNFEEVVDEESLIAEGQRQLDELIRYNENNDRIGQSHKNVYFFSISSSDNWIEYINHPSSSLYTEPNEEEILLGGSVSEVNDILQDFNSQVEEDKKIYICLVSKFPLKVTNLFSFHGMTIKEVGEAYTNLVGKDKAEVIEDHLKESVNGIFNTVLKGIVEGNSTLVSGNGYNSFKNSSDRILLGVSGIIASLYGHDESDPQTKTYKAKVRITKPKGYFNTHYDAIKSHLKSMGSTTAASDVTAIIQFVKNKMDDPNKMNFDVNFTDKSGTTDAALAASNNTYDLSDEGVLTNQYVYNFAGILDANVVQQLQSQFNGQQVISGAKLKLFITDDQTTPTDLAAIQNLDLTAPYHQNSIILWAHIGEDDQIQANVRYAPDIQSKLKSHIHPGILFKFAGESVSGSEFAFKVFASMVYKACSWVSDLIQNEFTIPEKYYRADSTEIYDPYYYDLFNGSISSAWVPSNPVLQQVIDQYLSEGAIIDDYSQVQFAFMCGLWNGLADEFKGLFDMGTMMGYWVDNKKKQEIDNLIDTFNKGELGDVIWTGFKKSHSGPILKVVHQVGKDVVVVAITFVPFAGQLAKAGKLGKVGSVINRFGGPVTAVTRVSNLLDVIDPLTYVFKASGVVIQTFGSQGMKFVRIVDNAVVGTIERSGVIRLADDLYIKSLAALDQLIIEGYQFVKKIEFAPGMQVKMILMNSGLELVVDNLSIYLRKFDGSDGPTDNGGSGKFFKGNDFNKFMQQFVDEFDLDANPNPVSKNVYEPALKELYEATNAYKLADNVNVREKIKTLYPSKEDQVALFARLGKLCKGRNKTKYFPDLLVNNNELLTVFNKLDNNPDIKTYFNSIEYDSDKFTDLFADLNASSDFFSALIADIPEYGLVKAWEKIHGAADEVVHAWRLDTDILKNLSDDLNAIELLETFLEEGNKAINLKTWKVCRDTNLPICP